MVNVDFPNMWPDFFNTLMQMLNLDVTSPLLRLRIVSVLNEVVKALARYHVLRVHFTSLAPALFEYFYNLWVQITAHILSALNSFASKYLSH